MLSGMTPEEAKQRLDREREICTLFIDSAKNYIQLSTASLLLSLAFARDFLSRKSPDLLQDWQILSPWFLWLGAILMGVTYQYCTIKYLEKIADDHELLYYKRTWSSGVPKPILENPYRMFGAMMVLFYLGILFFSYVAIFRASSLPR